MHAALIYVLGTFSLVLFLPVSCWSLVFLEDGAQTFVFVYLDQYAAFGFAIFCVVILHIHSSQWRLQKCH